MRIKFTTRQGRETTINVTKERAIDRLAYLDKVEADTQKYAPTDSGDTRFNYCAEAEAIRSAL